MIEVRYMKLRRGGASIKKHNMKLTVAIGENCVTENKVCRNRTTMNIG